jgi:GNAT superfamily N-acetyltransferase
MTTKVKAPKGFEFKIRKPYPGEKTVYIELHKKGGTSQVGRVNLAYAGKDMYGKDVFETHSYLDPAYRQKGFGTLLYARAIQWGVEHGCKVRSSTQTSTEAQRVWNGKSLRKFFSVKKRTWKNQYGGNVQKWYAYNKDK